LKLKGGVDSPLVIEVLSMEYKEVVYTIDGLMLADYLNMLNFTAHTTNATSKFGFTSLLAISSPDLWLKEGKFTLWTREEAEGVDTFMFGKHAENGWFGHFINSASAQQWNVTHQAEDGLIKLNYIAAGGAGDILFFKGFAPMEIVKQYQDLVT